MFTFCLISKENMGRIQHCALVLRVHTTTDNNICCTFIFVKAHRFSVLVGGYSSEQDWHVTEVQLNPPLVTPTMSDYLMYSFSCRFITLINSTKNRSCLLSK
jgi:hypothetical protein